MDAVDAGDDKELKEELGDLLLQVVLHSQTAAEAARFTLDDVATVIADMLVLEICRNGVQSIVYNIIFCY
jgi:uncharacterized protein YabN with tetrapyrrole methylase and pyrophosphatase domain